MQNDAARLRELQREIQKLGIEKQRKIDAKEGQGRKIPLEIIRDQQAKIAEEFDKKLAPLEMEERHLTAVSMYRATLEMAKWTKCMAIFTAVLALISTVGILLQVFSHQDNAEIDERLFQHGKAIDGK